MGYYSELAYDTEVCETNEAPSGKGGEAVISGDAPVSYTHLTLPTIA